VISGRKDSEHCAITTSVIENGPTASLHPLTIRDISVCQQTANVNWHISFSVNTRIESSFRETIIGVCLQTNV
jgi:hypothetical protein